MAMATLVSKESNESFYSTHSHQETPSLSHVSPDDVHSAAFEKGVPIYNVDAYLNDPRNREHGTSPPAKSPLHKEQKAGDGSSSSKPCTPVQLGAPRTSYHVAALYQLCQERGLRAEFEFDGDHSRWFGGMVTVGAQTLASEQRWRTKKEAKEGLAELALPVAREMEAVWKQKAEQASQEKNWVGMLLGEFFTADACLETSFPQSTKQPSKDRSDQLSILTLRLQNTTMRPTPSTPSPGPSTPNTL